MMKTLSCIFVLLLSFVFQAQFNILPPKEHKVHNIVLYPDKHSWCKVTPIKQIISHSGCQTKNIDNNVCVGTCFSFSVPRTIPETPGDDQLHYCDNCQSSDSTWITVNLECPESSGQTKVEKTVELIGNCSCATCKEKPGAASFLAPTADEEAEEEEEEDEDYGEENADNLKQLYEMQQMALKHVAMVGRRKNAAIASSTININNNNNNNNNGNGNGNANANGDGHGTSNKHLDLLEEEDLGQIDEETLRQAFIAGPVWSSLRAVGSALFRFI